MAQFLELEAVCLAYDTPGGRVPVVRDFSLGLERGSVGCLLGTSGCGKTTVLRAIAGFEPLRAGTIRLGGKTLSGAGTLVAPETRKVGMMFQDYALFPHLNTAQNVAFGLRRWPRLRQRQRVTELLALVGLEGHDGRYPHELSGGQQQRVALARALAPEPDLLLLDEPFSNLDADTREKLAFEVRDILKATGHTALVVTHSQDEAFAIGDRIGVMREGAMVQWDTPYALHHTPVSGFVADFIRHESLMARRAEARLRGCGAGACNASPAAPQLVLPALQN